MSQSFNRAAMHPAFQRALPWLVPVLVLASWQLSSSAGWLSTRVLPEPWAVLKAFWALTASGEIWQHVATSTWRALAGFGIGGGLGLVLGLLTGTFRSAETLLDSTLQMIRNIPALALIPLVILWFGIDEAAKLFLVALGVFFPIYLNTFHGIGSVDKGLIEMARSYGLRDLELQRVALTGSAAVAPASHRRRSGAAVHAQGLTKGFAGREVLKDVDLRIAPGEFVAIVGRSGCGKSTLLRLLAGLEAGDAGQVWLDGGVRSGRQDDDRILFQDARLLPWKRVLDNVALGLAGADAKERAREALAQVGLADRAQEWPAVLSGGQCRRVALARALVHRPRLLLLDEPLGALDALIRIEMQRLIERLWLRHGFTALLVIHDVAEAIALADRVVLIEEHRIALDEPVGLMRPRSRGQAAFAVHEERILERVLQQPANEPVPAAPERSPLPAQALRWAV